MFGMKIVILNWNNKCGRQKFGLLMDTEGSLFMYFKD